MRSPRRIKKRKARVKAEVARKLSKLRSCCISQRTTCVNSAKREAPRVFVSMEEHEAQRVPIMLAECEAQRARVMNILRKDKLVCTMKNACETLRARIAKNKYEVPTAHVPGLKHVVLAERQEARVIKPKQETLKDT